MIANVNVSFTALSDINQAVLNDSLFFANYAQVGMDVLGRENAFLGGTISVTSKPGMTSTLGFIGGGSQGALVATTNPGDPVAQVSAVGFGLVGPLTLDGASTYDATADGIPPSITFLNNAGPPNLLTATNALNYVPGTPGSWSTGAVPMPLQNAIDRIAASVAGLLGVPIP